MKILKLNMDQYHCCAKIVGFRHHRVFPLHDCRQRKPHKDLLDPIGGIKLNHTQGYKPDDS